MEERLVCVAVDRLTVEKEACLLETVLAHVPLFRRLATTHALHRIQLHAILSSRRK
jgi:hypothetical protein